ncbi:Lsr2 dimerization domain-containing protein [Actinoplanes awajinensis]|uniref:Lsr2 dimerization domain-containing protein n=1 Tax=Actinoplanes awajinensis subsp. mycoplanecinus TaxID=135947 RepID=A0A117MR78_9ACTN|nr:histone-like nucleoid-structuring protein Lsr2 [Actinoplanes awajinensis]KUL31421.1 hypothetical protein ADL15_22045 [Actinoplanes awajinensis subsp. mycoplanecinus]
MATRIQYIVVDDIDGTDSKVGTYRFAFDGVEYEIDLADYNFDKLAAALRPYLAVAHRLPKRKSTTTGPGKPGKNTSPSGGGGTHTRTTPVCRLQPARHDPAAGHRRQERHPATVSRVAIAAPFTTVETGRNLAAPPHHHQQRRRRGARGASVPGLTLGTACIGRRLRG